MSERDRLLAAGDYSRDLNPHARSDDRKDKLHHHHHHHNDDHDHNHNNHSHTTITIPPKEEPLDKFYLVRFLMVLCGFTVIFVSAALKINSDYYKAVFGPEGGESILFLIAISITISSPFVQIILTSFQDRITYSSRIYFCFITNTVLCLAFPFVLNSFSTNTAYYLALMVSILVGVNNSVLKITLVSLAAFFPSMYTHLFVTGKGLAPLLVIIFKGIAKVAINSISTAASDAIDGEKIVTDHGTFTAAQIASANATKISSTLFFFVAALIPLFSAFVYKAARSTLFSQYYFPSFRQRAMVKGAKQNERENQLREETERRDEEARQQYQAHMDGEDVDLSLLQLPYQPLGITSYLNTLLPINSFTTHLFQHHELTENQDQHNLSTLVAYRRHHYLRHHNVDCLGGPAGGREEKKKKARRGSAGNGLKTTTRDENSIEATTNREKKRSATPDQRRNHNNNNIYNDNNDEVHITIETPSTTTKTGSTTKQKNALPPTAPHRHHHHHHHNTSTSDVHKTVTTDDAQQQQEIPPPPRSVKLFDTKNLQPATILPPTITTTTTAAATTTPKFSSTLSVSSNNLVDPLNPLLSGGTKREPLVNLIPREHPTKASLDLFNDTKVMNLKQDGGMMVVVGDNDQEMNYKPKPALSITPSIGNIVMGKPLLSTTSSSSSTEHTPSSDTTSPSEEDEHDQFEQNDDDEGKHINNNNNNKNKMFNNVDVPPQSPSTPITPTTEANIVLTANNTQLNKTSYGTMDLFEKKKNDKNNNNNNQLIKPRFSQHSSSSQIHRHEQKKQQMKNYCDNTTCYDQECRGDCTHNNNDDSYDFVDLDAHDDIGDDMSCTSYCHKYEHDKPLNNKNNNNNLNTVSKMNQKKKHNMRNQNSNLAATAAADVMGKSGFNKSSRQHGGVGYNTYQTAGLSSSASVNANNNSNHNNNNTTLNDIVASSTRNLTQLLSSTLSYSSYHSQLQNQPTFSTTSSYHNYHDDNDNENDIENNNNNNNFLNSRDNYYYYYDWLTEQERQHKITQSDKVEGVAIFTNNQVNKLHVWYKVFYPFLLVLILTFTTYSIYPTILVKTSSTLPWMSSDWFHLGTLFVFALTDFISRVIPYDLIIKYIPLQKAPLLIYLRLLLIPAFFIISFAKQSTHVIGQGAENGAELQTENHLLINPTNISVISTLLHTFVYQFVNQVFVVWFLAAMLAVTNGITLVMMMRNYLHLVNEGEKSTAGSLMSIAIVTGAALGNLNAMLLNTIFTFIFK